MSLFRRIWLTVIGLTLAAFIGSLLVNIYSARGYLEKQLYLKNLDNANALAISMSQNPDKDPVTIELLLTAQFDTGHYQRITLTAPNGEIIAERQHEGSVDAGAPAWFIRLFPITTSPGIAHVQDGWKQYGTITLSSHSRFAYRDLWQGAMQLSTWFLVGGVIAGFLGTLLLRLVTRPLDNVVNQANALTERRFITIAEPKVPELRSVAQAMNGMVLRLKQMFADEAARLESLRHKVNHDDITGLYNRDAFIAHLREALSSEEAAPNGVLAFIRLSDLGEINSALGHADTDQLLRDIAAILKEQARDREHWIAGRVRGPDFSLLAPEATEAESLARTLAEGMQAIAARHPNVANLFSVAAIRYRRGDTLGNLLPAADAALATAEHKAANSWHAIEAEDINLVATSGDAWRSLLSDALSEQRLKLAQYPVISSTSGETLHQEGVIRLQAVSDGPWLSAGDFMPMAVRLKLTTSLDLQVVRMALNGLESSPGDIAVNLSADTISDWSFRNKLLGLMRDHPLLCKRLWIEVPENGVFQQVEAFRDLCRTLKELGCRVGIEHFGHRFSEISKISDLGLDYLKVDGSFIHDIHANAGNQEFLKGLCNIAHAIGVSVIAENVRSPEELAVLPGLGFDGVTGPAVKPA